MRKIRVGRHLTLWLNESPFPLIQGPDYILEHIVPAKPAQGDQTRHAALRYTGGHENINIIGADFRPANSDQLVIRIPVGGQGGPGYEGL
jgi:hypothetical protein